METIPLKDGSRGEWTGTTPLTLEQINTGCLQRIADSTELMARNYNAILQDLGTYKRWYKEQLDEIETLNRRISSLKGVITKLKNQK